MLNVNLFKKWNSALIDHYFGQDDEEEVLLYVDEEILDKIGSDNGIGDHNDFLNSVVINHAERKKLIHELLNEITTPRLNNKDSKLLGQKLSLLDHAKIFCTPYLDSSRKNYFSDKCYYFSFIILVMYIASKAQNYQKRDIGNTIINYLSQHLPDENTGYSAIEVLFENLHKYNKRFNNEIETSDRYVGLIRYQLVFSNQQLENLRLALFRCRLSDDLSFREKIVRLMNYVDDNWKAFLKDTLDNNKCRSRLEYIIDNFDPEDYRRSHQGGNLRNSGSLALCLVPSEKKLVLLSNVCGHAIDHEGNARLRFQYSGTCYDRLSDDYYMERVLLNGNTKAVMSRYSVDDGDYSLKSPAIGSFVFFTKAKYSKKHYIQTSKDQLKNVDTFIAVKNNKVEEWETWMNDYCPAAYKVDARYPNAHADIVDMLGNNWMLYQTGQFSARYFEDHKDKVEDESSKYILKKGGITPPKYDNVYLVNALPYYEFPEVIDAQKLKIFINADNENLDENNGDYRKFIQDNRLIIDIIKDLDYSNGPVHIDIKIEYKNYEFDTGRQQFNVCGQNVEYANGDLYKYDRWGSYIDSNDNSYLSGNNTNLNVGSIMPNPIHLTGRIPFDCIDDKFYFINLMSAICFMSNDKAITRSKLEKCIRYASTRMKLDMSDDEFILSKVKNLLVNCGYLCPKYGDVTSYQAMPPTFIKIPYITSYMLVGCYTRKFVNDLLDYCSSRNIKIYYRTYQDCDADLSLKFMPPALLIETAFNPNDFAESFEHKFEILGDRDLAYELLSYSAEIAHYGETLHTVEVAINLKNPNELDFPRIREDNSSSYRTYNWIEDSLNNFKQSDVVDTSWMQIFCKYRKNQNMILAEDKGHGFMFIYVPASFHLPFIVQRALSILNLGMPRYVNTFVVDNDINNNKLYTRMKIYDLFNVSNGYIDRLKTILSDGNSAGIRYVTGTKGHDYIELWRKKEQMMHGPNILMVMRRTFDNALVAISDGNYVAVNIQGQLKVVDDAPNVIFSKIIKSDISYTQLPYTFTGGTKTLPNKSDYNIENLHLLK